MHACVRVCVCVCVLVSVSEEKGGAPRQPLSYSFLELTLEDRRGLDLDLRIEMNGPIGRVLGKERT